MHIPEGVRSASVGDAPPDFLTEIGRVVVAWGHLEYRLHELLRELLSLDWASYEIMKPRSATGLVDALRRTSKRVLTAESLVELRKTLRTIDSGEAGCLLRRRNRVGHSLWWNPIDPPTRGPMAQGLLDDSLEQISLAELVDLSHGVEGAALALMGFRYRTAGDPARSEAT